MGPIETKEIAGIMGLYSPAEINNILKLVSELFSLIIITSVGTFAREMIFPKENTFKQNVGLSLIAGFIAFGVNIYYAEMMTLAYTALLCFALGFFVPAFKDWLKGKLIFRLGSRILRKAKDATTAVIDEVDDELNKEET